MSARKSARNAVKHGLCSQHFVAFENEEQIGQIREELLACFKPALDEEFALITDLAVARFKMHENERVHQARLDDEKLHAGHIYDMQILNEFRENLTRWRSTPMQYRSLMESGLFGCRHFLTQWRELQVILRNDHASPSLEQICEAALMLGSHWQIQLAGPAARHLVGLFLAMQSRPEQEIDHWIEISKGECRQSNSNLAHEIYALAPTAEKARMQMRALVDEQVRQLQVQLDSASAFYEFARKSYIAKSCGMGLTDPARSNEARLFHRYYVSERNYALKIERKLDSIRHQRLRQKPQSAAKQKPELQDQNPEAEPIKPEPAVVPASRQNLPFLNDPEFLAFAEGFRKAMLDPAANAPVRIVPASEPAPVEAGPDIQLSELAFARMPEFRHVQWHQADSVTALERETLQKCLALEPGAERNAMVSKYLGDEGMLRRANRKFSSAAVTA